MGADDVLPWLAWGYLAIAAFQALPRMRQDKGQSLALIVALASLCAACAVVLPQDCGWIQVMLVFVFLILPALLVRRVITALGRQRWKSAQALLAVAAVLLPLPVQRRLVQSLRTILAIERGDEGPGVATAQAATKDDPVHVFRMAFACRWHELDLEVGHVVKDVDDPSTTLLRMKIAYEVGAYDDALTALTRLERLAGLDAARALAAGRMLLLAAVGDGAGAAAIADRVKQHPDYRTYLLAICDWIAGHEERARPALTALGERAIPRIQWQARYRLQHPPPLSSELPAAWRERARLLVSDPSAMALRSTAPRMVLAVIAVNVGMFAFCALLLQQMVGDRMLPAIVLEKDWERVLRQMGALMPPTTLANSWRFASATMLHLGVLHLGMNMLNMYLLGRLLEPRLGPWRMLMLILVSGIGGNLVFDAVATLDGDAGEIAVGASGAVMGMVGALGAMALRAMRARLPGAATSLQLIVFTVLIQVMFDQSHPQVAGTAHLGGLVVGAISGWFLLDSAARAAQRRTSGTPPG